MSRASSVEDRIAEIREYVEREKRGEVASDRYSAARLLDATVYLLEIAEAARDVLASEAGEPDPQCACDYCDSRRRLRDALEADDE